MSSDVPSLDEETHDDAEMSASLPPVLADPTPPSNVATPAAIGKTPILADKSPSHSEDISVPDTDEMVETFDQTPVSADQHTVEAYQMHAVSSDVSSPTEETNVPINTLMHTATGTVWNTGGDMDKKVSGTRNTLSDIRETSTEDEGLQKQETLSREKVDQTGSDETRQNSTEKETFKKQSTGIRDKFCNIESAETRESTVEEDGLKKEKTFVPDKLDETEKPSTRPLTTEEHEEANLSADIAFSAAGLTLCVETRPSSSIEAISHGYHIPAASGGAAAAAEKIKLPADGSMSHDSEEQSPIGETPPSLEMQASLAVGATQHADAKPPCNAETNIAFETDESSTDITQPPNQQTPRDCTATVGDLEHTDPTDVRSGLEQGSAVKGDSEDAIAIGLRTGVLRVCNITASSERTSAPESPGGKKSKRKKKRNKQKPQTNTSADLIDVRTATDATGARSDGNVETQRGHTDGKGEKNTKTVTDTTTTYRTEDVDIAANVIFPTETETNTSTNSDVSDAGKAAGATTAESAETFQTPRGKKYRKRERNKETMTDTTTTDQAEDVTIAANIRLQPETDETEDTEISSTYAHDSTQIQVSSFHTPGKEPVIELITTTQTLSSPTDTDNAEQVVTEGEDLATQWTVEKRDGEIVEHAEDTSKSGNTVQTSGMNYLQDNYPEGRVTTPQHSITPKYSTDRMCREYTGSTDDLFRMSEDKADSRLKKPTDMDAHQHRECSQEKEEQQARQTSQTAESQIGEDEPTTTTTDLTDFEENINTDRNSDQRYVDKDFSPQIVSGPRPTAVCPTAFAHRDSDVSEPVNGMTGPDDLKIGDSHSSTGTLGLSDESGQSALIESDISSGHLDQSGSSAHQCVNGTKSEQHQGSRSLSASSDHRHEESFAQELNDVNNRQREEFQQSDHSRTEKDEDKAAETRQKSGRDEALFTPPHDQTRTPTHQIIGSVQRKEEAQTPADPNPVTLEGEGMEISTPTGHIHSQALRSLTSTPCSPTLRSVNESTSSSRGEHTDKLQEQIYVPQQAHSDREAHVYTLQQQLSEKGDINELRHRNREVEDVSYQKEKIEELNRDLRKKDTNKKTTKKLQDLQQEVNRKDDAIREADEERGRLQEELESLRQKFENIKRSMMEHTATHDRASRSHQDEVTNLQRQLTDLSRTCSQLKTQNSKLSDTVDSLREEDQLKATDIQCMSRLITQETAGKDAAMDAKKKLESDVEQLTAERNKLLESAWATEQALSAQLQELQSTNTNLEDRLRQLTGQLTRVQTQRVVWKMFAGKLLSSLVELKGNHGTAQQDLSEERNLTESLQHRLKAALNDAVEVKVRYDLEKKVLEAQHGESLNTLQQDEARKTEVIRQLEAENASLSEDLTSLTQRLEREAHLRAASESETGDLRGKLAEVTSEQSRKDGLIFSLTQSMNKETSEKERAQALYHQQASTIATLTSEKTYAKETLAECRQQLGSFKTQRLVWKFLAIKHGRKIRSMETTLQDLQKDLQSERNLNSSHTLTLKDALNKSESTRGLLVEEQKKNQEMSSEAARHKDTITRLAAEVKKQKDFAHKVTGEKANLEDERRQLGEMITGLESQAQQSRKEMERAKLEKRVVEDENRSLKDQLATLKQQWTALHTQTTSAQAAQFTAQLRAKEKELADTTAYKDAQINELNARLRQLEEGMRLIQMEAQRVIETENTASETKILNLQLEKHNADLTDELSTKTTEVAALEREQEQLRANLRESVEQIHRYMQECQAARDQLQMIMVENQRLKLQLETLRPGGRR